MSSTEDSPAIVHRRKGRGGAVVLNSDDDDELPEWAANFKSPYTGGFKSQASSSEDEKPAKKSAGTGRDKEEELAPKHEDRPDQGRSKPEALDHREEREHGTQGSPREKPGKTSQAPANAGAAGQPEPRPSKAPKRGAPPEDHKEDRKAGGALTGAGARGPSEPSPSKAPKRGAPSEDQQEHRKAGGAPARAGAVESSAPSPSRAQKQDAPTDEQEHKDEQLGSAPSSSKPGGDKNKATNLVIPDKLPRNKVMAELCPGEDDQLVDLAGDSGAVGRMIVAGEQGIEQLQVDLKGAMFDASVLPLAGTALVVNIGPSEAKVEALMNDYLHLHPIEGLLDEDDGGYGKDLMVSEDENYQPEQEGAPAEEGKTSKKKAGKASAKATNKITRKPRGGTSAAGSKQSGGVRKKTGPPKKGGASKPKIKK
ncbi:hypothetical protein DUNSADRAFT_18328 [Dunaliella salina]|uniref:DNA-binding protein BIN4 n=1 Tax=Dunaliella salina TaxID=3046 RepID=A0ABQ7GZ88_DUNSA|nr:hypothetical protein DUNSADRAFT_18328 [Dunaliella salina]|eukprot:KAF5839914.1 hypothetical protein DUNSADRAFT_18328 [Dunaliella salina]